MPKEMGNLLSSILEIRKRNQIFFINAYLSDPRLHFIAFLAIMKINSKGLTTPESNTAKSFLLIALLYFTDINVRQMTLTYSLMKKKAI